MSLKKLSTNEKLDAVLKYLNDSYSATFVKADIRGVEHGQPVKKHNAKNDLEISLGISFGQKAQNIDELKLILEYLCESEKLILRESINKEDNYRILYSGKVFIEKGGFVGEKCKDIIRVSFEILGLSVTTLGALAAGVYAITQIFRH